VNRRNLILLATGYFFVLFNYPLVRASSTTFFVEAYGAKASPQGWLVAVFLLIIAVTLTNALQARQGFQRTFSIVSCASVALFTASYWAYQQGIREGAFVLFAWKEVYIVLQVHLFLAYTNAWLSRDDFKRWIGPIGAMGSLGGVLGGMLTTWWARDFGTGMTLLLGQLFVFLPAAIGLFLVRVETQVTPESPTTPLSSLNTVAIRRYVACIAGLVALSQIVINIADFQFSLAFEAAISSASERTAYLGHLYTAQNALTLVLQLAVLPVLLRVISERTLHLFIPLSYLICLAFGLSGSMLTATAILFTYLKASDYSLFSAGKELLYQSLAPLQKYGAKYLTDMFVYRTAKAGIAAVLIYFQSPEMLLGMMTLALLAWPVLVWVTFSQYRRIFS
jgi:AAA family ATP:ADP antiporter